MTNWKQLFGLSVALLCASPAWGGLPPSYETTLRNAPGLKTIGKRDDPDSVEGEEDPPPTPPADPPADPPPAE